MKATLNLAKDNLSETIYSAKVITIDDYCVRVEVVELDETQAQTLFAMGCHFYWFSASVEVQFKRELLNSIVFMNK